MTASTDLFTFSNVFGKEGFLNGFFISLSRNDLGSQEICEKTKILSKVSPIEKSNSKQTHSFISKKNIS